MTLQDKVNRLLVELDIPEDFMVDVINDDGDVCGGMYLEDVILIAIDELTKKRWKCDLHFWLRAYDRVQLEQNMCSSDSTYLYEHFSQPYSDETKEHMQETFSRQIELNNIENFIQERILRYNR